MKQYILQEDYLQYPKGTVFSGQLPIFGQSALGYYPKGTENAAPGVECLFASFVEHSDIFDEQKENPGINAGDLTK